MTRPQIGTCAASIAATVSVLALSTAGPALAGAFALSERSAEAQGTSFASANSGGTDVTFAGFNPAALSRVQNFESGGNLSLLLIQSDGSSPNVFAGGATTSFDPSDIALVPAGAVGYRLTDDIVVGLTLNSQFGLRTDYPNNAGIWPGALNALESNLLTVTATPMISYNILPNLAIAGGPSVTYIDATLSSAVGAPGTLGAGPGGFPVGKLEGDAFAYSFQAGLLWDPLPGTSVGLSYAHGYELDIQDGTFTAPFGRFAGTASASIPGAIGVGVRQDLDDDVTIMADFRYYLWNSFDVIDIDITGIGDASEVTEYRNAFFAAVGIEAEFAPGFRARTGVAFDQTPTTDGFRSPRVPDEDRFWFSVGASYDLNESMSLDLAYSLLVAETSTVQANGVDIFAPITYDGMVHIISLGGSMKF